MIELRDNSFFDFAQAYVSMIEAMKWASFTILYEDSEGLVRLQEVLKMSTSKKDIKIAVRQLIPDPGGDYRYTIYFLCPIYRVAVLLLHCMS